MAHDPDARGIGIRQSADKVHEAARVSDPLPESCRAGVPESKIRNGLAVRLAVAFAKPADSHCNVTVLCGRVGECIDVSSGREPASAEVLGSGDVYVIEGYDQHGQRRAARVARPEYVHSFS